MMYRWGSFIIAGTILGAAGIAGCRSVIDGILSDEQGSDGNDAPYLMVARANRDSQPRDPSLGTIVYIQWHGGQRLAVHTHGGAFQYGALDGGTDTTCIDSPQEYILPARVVPASRETILEVWLMEDDAKETGAVDAGADAGDDDARYACPHSHVLRASILDLSDDGVSSPDGGDAANLDVDSGQNGAADADTDASDGTVNQ